MRVFVGRARELGVLGAAAAAARRGEPRVVLVEGDGGAGKSSLLMRFASGLADAAVLRASGDEAEQLVSYGVVGQLVTGARTGGSRLPGLLASDLRGGSPTGRWPRLGCWPPGSRPCRRARGAAGCSARWICSRELVA